MLEFTFANNWPSWVPTLVTILVYVVIGVGVWFLPNRVSKPDKTFESGPFDLRVAASILCAIQIGLYLVFA